MSGSSGPDREQSPKSVARHLRSSLGGEPAARRYYNEDESSVIVIVTLTCVPAPGWAVHSTAGLKDAPNLLDGKSIPVELLGCAAADDARMANVIATSAFCVAVSGWLAAPGVVFPDAVGMYVPDSTVPHLLWVEPFAFPELGSVDTEETGKVHWLQGVPVSGPEVALLHSQGFDALERLLDDAEVPYFDLWRESTC